jgi:hypothetical protein
LGGLVLIVTEKHDVTTLVQVTVNSNKKEQRGKLFGYLDNVITVSQTKFKMEKAPNDDRQAWGRIIVSAVQAYGKILNDEDFEEVKHRLEALEQTVNKR